MRWPRARDCLLTAIALVTLASNVALFAGCASSGSALPGPESPEARVYARSCSVCHAAPAPQRLEADYWGERIVVLDPGHQMPVVSERERAEVVDHLRSSGDATRRAYERRCAKCHAAPDPEGLDAAVWEDRLVVMSGRMPVFSETDREQVVRYLERYGR